MNNGDSSFVGAVSVGALASERLHTLVAPRAVRAVCDFVLLHLGIGGHFR